MIKTILIDDEPLARDIIRYYLADHSEIEIVAECKDGFDGLKAIAQYEPDLVFLDVQMPKISGFEMLELVERPPAVIFSTAFDEFALKAFEVNAIDYLLKPIEKARFDQAVKKVIAKSKHAEHTIELLNTPGNPAQRDRIVVKVDKSIKIIPAAEILYIEADDDQVKISTTEGGYFKNKTMSFFEQTLDPMQFIRVHRSYIINLNQVSKIELKEKENYVVLLKSGLWLPVSKGGYLKLKLALGI